MKVLIIKQNEGYFLNKEGEEETIDKISVSDLEHIIKLFFDNNIEFDEEIEDIRKPEERIIYEKILKKLMELDRNKGIIMNKINEEFELAKKKYN